MQQCNSIHFNQHCSVLRSQKRSRKFIERTGLHSKNQTKPNSDLVWFVVEGFRFEVRNLRFEFEVEV